MRPASAIAACCAKAPAADVVVYDLNGLGIEPDWVGEIVHDFPGGEWRRVQRAKGYRSIIVNGERPSTKAIAPAPPRASCCATATPEP